MYLKWVIVAMMVVAFLSPVGATGVLYSEEELEDMGYCLQETATESSDDCGVGYTNTSAGSYEATEGISEVLWDGDSTTCASRDPDAGEGESLFYVTYLKPPIAVGGIWEVILDGYHLTQIVPASCWIQPELEFRVSSEIGEGWHLTTWYCYDGISWSWMGMVDADFCEERMWWLIPECEDALDCPDCQYCDEDSQCAGSLELDIECDSIWDCMDAPITRGCECVEIEGIMTCAECGEDSDCDPDEDCIENLCIDIDSGAYAYWERFGALPSESELAEAELEESLGYGNFTVVGERGICPTFCSIAYWILVVLWAFVLLSMRGKGGEGSKGRRNKGLLFLIALLITIIVLLWCRLVGLLGGV